MTDKIFARYRSMGGKTLLTRNIYESEIPSKDRLFFIAGKNYRTAYVVQDMSSNAITITLDEIIMPGH